MPKSTKILSLNICHSRNDMGGLIDLINRVNPPIICLQEVIQDTDELLARMSSLGYMGKVSLGPNKKPGVAIMYKDHIVGQITELESGRIMRLKTGKFTVYNIYGPAGTLHHDVRKEFFNEHMLSNMLREETLPILVGDFNCVLETIDVERNFERKTCLDLKTMLNILEYKDAFRLTNGNTIEYTYGYGNPNSTKSRIDRMHVPKNLVDKVVKTEHLATLSDHKALVVTLQFQDYRPKREYRQTYWKLNTKVLAYPGFTEIFETFWDEKIDQKPDIMSWAEYWEMELKPSIQTLLQSLSKERAKIRRSLRTYLYAALEHANRESQWDDVYCIKERLKRMCLEDMDGLVIRSKGREYIDEEKGSIFHLEKILKQAKENNLSKLKVNGVESENHDEIEQEVLGFYKALFNGHHRSVGDSLKPQDTGQPFQEDLTYLDQFLDHVPVLTPQHREALARPIQLMEIVEALKTSAKHRSPGLDGLPHEFYQETVHIIGPTLAMVFQEQLDSNSLIQSGREGVTRLIPKVTEVPSVGQLRPITLLNCDYKLMSKILATRLNKILPSLLTSSQLCTTKPRTIMSGVTEMISAIEYVRTKNKGVGYIVSLDAYKAFDKANVSLILRIMEKMEFGDEFVSWIRTMHNDVGTRFILGNLTERLNVPLSLRQGDNIAMPLFLLVMEPLLLALDRRLQGLNMGPIEIKSIAYVDDVQIISSHENDLVVADQILREYESLSGMVLSREKTKILGLGGWKNKQEWVLPWAKPVKELKAFGVTFMPSASDTARVSWKNCKESVNKCISVWTKRPFQTLKQRVFILNTYALSKLWYLAQVLPAPRGILGEIEQKCRCYVWQGRLEQVGWDTLVAPREEGGLGIPWLQSKCSALRMRHTQTGFVHPRTSGHFGYWIGDMIMELYPELKLDQGHRRRTVPPHFKGMVELVREGLVYDLGLNAKSKTIYKALTSTPPPPKVVTIHDLDWTVVYNRIWSKVLTLEQQDLLWTMVNNIYPTRERLFRLNQRVRDNNCKVCENVVENVNHLFLRCPPVLDLWLQVQQRFPQILGDPADDWINVSYNTCNKDNEKLYILGTVLEYIDLRRKAGTDGSTARLDILTLMGRLAAGLKSERSKHLVINL